MTRFVLRWLINAVALFAAIAFVPGIHQQGEGWMAIIWLALIFGLLNAFLRPILSLLTCLFNLLTIGLFTLIINTIMFWLAGLVGTNFGVGFTVDGFWPAFFGALVVSVVSIVLSLVFKDELKHSRK
jgi:putative membrane protein